MDYCNICKNKKSIHQLKQDYYGEYYCKKCKQYLEICEICDKLVANFEDKISYDSETVYVCASCNDF